MSTRPEVVIQADREAAWPWAASPQDAGDVRTGKADDSPLVQAFAKHRLLGIEACAKLAENRCYNPPSNAAECIWNEAGDDIAAAVRAMDKAGPRQLDYAGEWLPVGASRDRIEDDGEVTPEIDRTLAAGRIMDVMTGGKFDWRSRLDDDDFLESGDWQRALAYADAARAPNTEPSTC